MDMPGPLKWANLNTSSLYCQALFLPLIRSESYTSLVPSSGLRPALVMLQY